MQETKATATEALCARALAGDRAALARLISWIENGSADLSRLCASIYPRVGSAALVGITGPPGAGKSTLVAAVARVLRAEGKNVSILAVDPSSPVSGGAVLGDRVRMLDLETGGGLFIRSLGARGHLGGLSARTLLVADLLDAAGSDVILVETVGVGQSEIEIAGLADVTVVVLAPGFGDDVQGIKAGILEVADIFVVNKADRPGARQLAGTLRNLSRADGNGSSAVPVIECIASDGTGAADLVAAIATHPARVPQDDDAAGRRLARTLRELALDEFRRRLGAVEEAALTEAAARLLRKDRSAPIVVQEILDLAAQTMRPAPAHLRTSKQ